MTGVKERWEKEGGNMGQRCRLQESSAGEEGVARSRGGAAGGQISQTDLCL